MDETQTRRGGAPAPAPERSQRRGWLRKLAFSGIATLLLLLVVEGAFSVLFSVWTVAREEPWLPHYCRHDPDLGWMNIPSHRVEDMYGPGKHYTTNARAFRALREYDEKPPAGKYRIVCLGDSFTLGYGVDDDESLVARMEQSSPELEVVNMGLGGFGLDQDYLWYKRDGVDLESDALIFAVIVDDFARVTEDSFLGYQKPLLRAVDGALQIENVPVPDWGSGPTGRRLGRLAELLGIGRALLTVRDELAGAPQQAFAAEVPGSALPGTDVAALVFDDLHRLSRERGQHFVLVYLPCKGLGTEEPTPYTAWLARHAEQRGIPFVDLTAVLAELPPWDVAACFGPHRHYTVKGNELMAGALLAALRALLPDVPP